eukprot:Partr_v1_DN24999_c1_g1_i2_m45486 putative 3-keto-dihydrosphingosine reductase
MQSLIDRLLIAIGRGDQVGNFHPALSVAIGCLLLLLAYSAFAVVRGFTRRQWKVSGTHCLVTGGSKGLGKSLAIQLAAKGAHVTIVARNKADLKAAVEEIKNARVSDNQLINYVSADVTSAKEARDAVSKAYELTGMVPKTVFTCAGASKPGLFLDQDLNEYAQGMDLNYLGTVNVIQPAVQLMVEHGESEGGRVVMTSSILGLFGLVGYGQYVPTKFALRGLAEVLRMELLPLGIDVHIMFPATIYTPGYEEEEKRKPAITKIIEAADEGQKPEQIAKALLTGISRGQFQITSDIVGELMRCVSKGVAPANGTVTDGLLAGLGWLIFPFWRMYVDFTVMQHYQQSHSSASKKSE